MPVSISVECTASFGIVPVCLLVAFIILLSFVLFRCFTCLCAFCFVLFSFVFVVVVLFCFLGGSVCLFFVCVSVCFMLLFSTDGTRGKSGWINKSRYK